MIKTAIIHYILDSCINNLVTYDFDNMSKHNILVRLKNEALLMTNVYKVTTINGMVKYSIQKCYSMNVYESDINIYVDEVTLPVSLIKYVRNIPDFHVDNIHDILIKELYD